MPSARTDRLHMRLGVVTALAVAGSLCMAAWIWRAKPMAVTVDEAPVIAQPEDTTVKRARINAAIWRQTLYQALRDPPPEPVKPKPPPQINFSLFAVAEDQGRQQAVLDFPEDGLKRLGEGEVYKKIKITKIESQRVHIDFDGYQTVLEFAND